MFVEVMDELCQMVYQEKGGDQEYRHRPSSAGPEKCVRQSVYHALKVERQPLPGRFVRVFDDGSWHEELTLDILRRGAFNVNSQHFRFDIFEVNGFMVSGEIDSLVRPAASQEEYVWEHKALNHFTFQRYESGAETPRDYFTQLALYIRGIQKLVPEISKGILLIKNKNTAKYLEYELRLDGDTARITGKKKGDKGDIFDIIVDPIDKITESAREKFLEVDKWLKKKTLPPRQYEYGQWRCDYCAWGGLCWKGYTDKEFKQREKIVELPEHGEKIEELYTCTGERLALEKMEKALKAELSVIAAKAKAAKILAGEYELVVSMRPGRKTVPEEIREKHSVPGKPYEQISAKKRKEEK